MNKTLKVLIENTPLPRDLCGLLLSIRGDRYINYTIINRSTHHVLTVYAYVSGSEMIGSEDVDFDWLVKYLDRSGFGLEGNIIRCGWTTYDEIASSPNPFLQSEELKRYSRHLADTSFSSTAESRLAQIDSTFHQRILDGVQRQFPRRPDRYYPWLGRFNFMVNYGPHWLMTRRAVELNPCPHCSYCNIAAFIKLNLLHDIQTIATKWERKDSEYQYPYRYYIDIHPGNLCLDGTDLKDKNDFAIRGMQSKYFAPGIFSDSDLGLLIEGLGILGLLIGLYISWF
jgi:hypothetical protein